MEAISLFFGGGNMKELDKIKEQIKELKKENEEIKMCIYGLIYDTEPLREKERKIMDDKCYRPDFEDRNILLSDRSNDSFRNNKINI